MLLLYITLKVFHVQITQQDITQVNSKQAQFTNMIRKSKVK